MTPAAVGGALAGYVAEKVVEATFRMARSEKSTDSIYNSHRFIIPASTFDDKSGFASTAVSMDHLSDDEIDQVIDGLATLETTQAVFKDESLLNRHLSPEEVRTLVDFNRLDQKSKRATLRGHEANFLTAIAAGAAAGAAICLAKEIIRAAGGRDRPVSLPNESYFDLK